MQINKLYETKITCSNYNPNIDDTITVTVALIDFNGNNVTGTNATISVNQGYFTKYTRNSSDTAISGTSTKNYTGTTGTDGTFTMTYKCSEWGLATFSANNNKIQLLVNNSSTYDVKSKLGFKSTHITLDESTMTLTKIGNLVSCQFRLFGSGGTFETQTFENIITNNNVIPEGYRPRSNVIYTMMDTSHFTSLPSNNSSSEASLGALEISTAGTIQLEKIHNKKGSFNFYGTFTYSV